MHSVIKRTLITVIFAIPTLAVATPITFNFTGTVSDYILSNGQLQKSSSAIPKWNGKSVSGSVTMDLDNAVPKHKHSEQTYYETATYNTNEKQWLSFIINNPDGTSYDIPAAINPLPSVDVNGSVASLLYRPDYDHSFFYVGRTFSNLAPKNPPRQNMSLRLGSFGESSHQLLDSVDFDTVEFHPKLATNENYGLVTYVKDNGKKMDYAFRIDSLTRAVSQVPEPDSLWLVALGFAGLLVNRARRSKSEM